jgi:hypothetical protein
MQQYSTSTDERRNDSFLRAATADEVDCAVPACPSGTDTCSSDSDCSRCWAGGRKTKQKRKKRSKTTKFTLKHEAHVMHLMGSLERCSAVKINQYRAIQSSMDLKGVIDAT